MTQSLIYSEDGEAVIGVYDDTLSDVIITQRVK